MTKKRINAGMISRNLVKKIELKMLYPIKPSLKYEGIIKIFSGIEVLKD